MAFGKETTDEKMAAVLDLLIDKIGELGKSNGGLTNDQLERLLEKTAGNTAEAFRTALIPENKIHPGISAYSYAEGDYARPKPTLKAETIFCGYRQRADNMTPEEIEACNALADGQTYTAGPNARHQQWSARLLKEGLKDVLVIHCDEAVERERARDLPSMLTILMELKGGAEAVDLGRLTRQLDEMRRQLQEAGRLPKEAVA